MDDDVRKAAEREAEQLEDAAEELEDRVRTPRAYAAWTPIDARLRTLATAFGHLW